MAKKGVNLLDDDGEERDPEEEEGAEAVRPPSRSREGGSLIRNIIIAAAAVVLLSGVGWAGYAFWWVPSKQKEEERLKAQQRLEELRKQRLAQLRAEAEQRKQALAIIEQVQAEQQGKGGAKPGEPAGTSQTSPVEAPAGSAPKTPPAPAAQAPKEAAGTAQMPKSDTAKKSSEAAPKQEMAAKKEPAPTASRQAPSPPSQEMAAAKPPAPPSADGQGKQAQEVAPPKSMDKPAARTEKPAPRMAQMRPQDGAQQEKAAPRTPPARQNRRAASGSRVYSVQVASCRTERCVQSFVSRLREKGMDPRVSGNGAGNGPTNEVLLGSFATREEAENLAGQAKDKNLRAVAYESGGRWRVSAGSFRDLEDAAQMLDRVEDAGFRGELARRPGAPQGGAGLRAIRTGSFATRREALAERSRVVGAGFQGAFVVAEPRR